MDAVIKELKVQMAWQIKTHQRQLFTAIQQHDPDTAFHVLDAYWRDGSERYRERMIHDPMRVRPHKELFSAVF